MSNLKVIAVDDEFRALEIIERYVAKVPFLEWEGSFKKPLEALSFLKNTEVDLIFLDINMPEISGTALASLLKPHQQVVFTTAYSEFAIDGFTLDATDYLLKPIEFERFLKACVKAKDHFDLRKGVVSDMNSSEHSVPILFKSGGKSYRLMLDNVLFFEKQGNDMLIHLADKEPLVVRISIKELFDLIPADKFCQVHKSFIVALNRVNSFERHQIQIGTHNIPIGRNYREGFLSRV